MPEEFAAGSVNKSIIRYFGIRETASHKFCMSSLKNSFKPDVSNIYTHFPTQEAAADHLLRILTATRLVALKKTYVVDAAGRITKQKQLKKKKLTTIHYLGIQETASHTFKVTPLKDSFRSDVSNIYTHFPTQEAAADHLLRVLTDKRLAALKKTYVVDAAGRITKQKQLKKRN